MIKKGLKPFKNYIPISEELYKHITKRFKCKSPIIRYAIGKYNSYGEFNSWMIELNPIKIQVEFRNWEEQNKVEVMQISKIETVKDLRKRIGDYRGYFNFRMWKIKKCTKKNSSEREINK
jgi:tRNA U38,U39,U40 pseudouridine synthase TruA